jgi:hypothetical protein
LNSGLLAGFAMFFDPINIIDILYL